MNMKACEVIRREMVQYLSGESDGANVQAHIGQCAACRAEWGELSTLMKGVEALDKQSEAAMSGIDWKRTAREISRNAMTETPLYGRQVVIKKLRLPLAAALFGFGLLTGYFIFRGNSTPTFPEATPMPMAESIRIVETEMDRREIIDFLGRARLLLVELRQQKLSVEDRRSLSVTAEKLLREYRYLAQNLSGSRLQGARSVLEKLSWLLTEIAQDELPSRERMAETRRFLERERLLLKVRLVERELAISAREV